MSRQESKAQAHTANSMKTTTQLKQHGHQGPSTVARQLAAEKLADAVQKQQRESRQATASMKLTKPNQASEAAGTRTGPNAVKSRMHATQSKTGCDQPSNGAANKQSRVLSRYNDVCNVSRDKTIPNGNSRTKATSRQKPATATERDAQSNLEQAQLHQQSNNDDSMLADLLMQEDEGMAHKRQQPKRAANIRATNILYMSKKKKDKFNISSSQQSMVRNVKQSVFITDPLLKQLVKIKETQKVAPSVAPKKDKHSSSRHNVNNIPTKDQSSKTQQRPSGSSKRKQRRSGKRRGQSVSSSEEEPASESIAPTSVNQTVTRHKDRSSRNQKIPATQDDNKKESLLRRRGTAGAIRKTSRRKQGRNAGRKNPESLDDKSSSQNLSQKDSQGSSVIKYGSRYSGGTKNQLTNLQKDRDTLEPEFLDVDKPFDDPEMERNFQNFIRLLKFKHRKNYMIQQLDNGIDQQFRNTFNIDHLTQQVDLQMTNSQFAGLSDTALGKLINAEAAMLQETNTCNEGRIEHIKLQIEETRHYMNNYLSRFGLLGVKSADDVDLELIQQLLMMYPGLNQHIEGFLGLQIQMQELKLELQNLEALAQKEDCQMNQEKLVESQHTGYLNVADETNQFNEFFIAAGLTEESAQKYKDYLKLLETKHHLLQEQELAKDGDAEAANKSMEELSPTELKRQTTLEQINHELDNANNQHADALHSIVQYIWQSNQVQQETAGSYSSQIDMDRENVATHNSTAAQSSAARLQQFRQLPGVRIMPIQVEAEQLELIHQENPYFGALYNLANWLIGPEGRTFDEFARDVANRLPADLQSFCELIGIQQQAGKVNSQGHESPQPDHDSSGRKNDQKDDATDDKARQEQDAELNQSQSQVPAQEEGQEASNVARGLQEHEAQQQQLLFEQYMNNLSNEEIAAMDPEQWKKLLEMLDPETIALLQAQQRQEAELAQRQSLIEQENLRAFNHAAQQEAQAQKRLSELLKPGQAITDETAREVQAIFDILQQTAHINHGLPMQLPFQSDQMHQMGYPYMYHSNHPLVPDIRSLRHVEICNRIQRHKQDQAIMLELLQHQEHQFIGNEESSLLDFKNNRQLQEHLQLAQQITHGSQKTHVNQLSQQEIMNVQ